MELEKKLNDFNFKFNNLKEQSILKKPKTERLKMYLEIKRQEEERRKKEEEDKQKQLNK